MILGMYGLWSGFSDSEMKGNIQKKKHQVLYAKLGED